MGDFFSTTGGFGGRFFGGCASTRESTFPDCFCSTGVEIDPRHPKSSKYLARIGVKGTPESLLDVWGFKH